MKLLPAQEIAVERAREKHRLVETYQTILAELAVKEKELINLETRLHKVRDEIFTYLNNL